MQKINKPLLSDFINDYGYAICSSCKSAREVEHTIFPLRPGHIAVHFCRECRMRLTSSELQGIAERINSIISKQCRHEVILLGECVSCKMKFFNNS